MRPGAPDEHEQRYRELFKHTNDCVFLLDVTPDGHFRIAGFNPAEERLVGVSSEEATGRLVEQVVPPDVAAPLLANYRRCVETAAPFSYEEEIDLPAGRRSFATTLVPLFDGSARVHRIIGVARDITEKKVVHRALEESEETFRQLAENIREVFWIADADSPRVVYVSPAYEVIWGRTCESLRDDPRSWLDAVHPADRARVEEALPRQRSARTESTYRVVQPNGSERWIRDRSFPVHDADGVVRRIVGFAEDITRLVEAESMLRQSQKLEALGRLAGGVAHDFNNILSIILSYTSFAIDGLGPGSPVRGDLVEVHRAGERAVGLTRQLLAFSRRQTLQPQLLDLGEVVAGMEKMLRRLVGEDIELTLKAPAARYGVRADPGQIEQVLLNLAVNARDAMPDGGKLVIETASVILEAERAGDLAGLEPGAYVRLRVQDTGIGMDDATCARIFEPFFTTKEAGKGTGLGLATVHGIVQQSHGAIRVASAPGQGASFDVYLPRVNSAPHNLTAPPATGTQARGTETILLVEDDPAVRGLAREILRRSGYQVLEAENAGEALLLCEQHRGPIDLLLTDVVMPRMNGRQLAGRLAPLRPAMRVLYMSGYTDDALARHGLGTPDAPLFRKPVTPEALVRKVRETLA